MSATLTAPVRTPLFAAAFQASQLLLVMQPDDAQFTVQLNDSGVPFIRLSWPDSFAHFNFSTLGGRATLSAEYTDPDYETHKLCCPVCSMPLASLQPGAYAYELFAAVVITLKQSPLTAERF